MAQDITKAWSPLPDTLKELFKIHPISPFSKMMDLFRQEQICRYLEGESLEGAPEDIYLSLTLHNTFFPKFLEYIEGEGFVTLLWSASSLISKESMLCQTEKPDTFGSDCIFVRENILISYEPRYNHDLNKCSSAKISIICPHGHKIVNELTVLMQEHFRSTEKTEIYTIVQTRDGFQLEGLGSGGMPLEKGNYTNEVLAGYAAIVRDLSSKKPFGRLSILNGLPGSGKTYCIRGLIEEVKTCKFVIVPPHLVSHLGDPEFMTFFVTERSYEDESRLKPIVLVLEDADSCLCRRGGDNMASVSAILNLTDGILGQTIDIRIVATTNAERVDMDDALLRKGRLSATITLEELDKEHAADIYARITGCKDPDKVEKMTKDCKTLADVYAVAHGEELETEKSMRRTRVVGFGSRQ